MAYISLGLIYNSLGDKEMSSIYFQKALEMERTPRCLYEFCVVLMTQRNSTWSSEKDLIISMLEEILKLNPTYKGVYGLLGGRSPCSEN